MDRRLEGAGLAHWKKLDEVIKTHDIEWVWVKGHSGHEGNERADALANKGAETVR